MQYRHHPNGAWTLWQTLDETARSSTVTGLAPGGTYRVRVRAQNGFGWGRYSDPFAEITLPRLVSDPPANVTGVTASRRNGYVVASWDAAAGATKYHVTYTDNGGKSWHAPIDNNTNVTSTNVTFRGQDGKTYVVGVRAGNDAGWSAWANSNTVPAVAAPPVSVGAVKATHHGNSVTARWPAADMATKYHVTYTDNGGSSWSLAADAHTGTSITISGADTGKSYIVGVRAGNDAGWSAWVNSAPAEHNEGASGQ